MSPSYGSASVGSTYTAMYGGGVTDWSFYFRLQQEAPLRWASEMFGKMCLVLTLPHYSVNKRAKLLKKVFDLENSDATKTLQRNVVPNTANHIIHSSRTRLLTLSCEYSLSNVSKMTLMHQSLWYSVTSTCSDECGKCYPWSFSKDPPQWPHQEARGYRRMSLFGLSGLSKCIITQAVCDESVNCYQCSTVLKSFYSKVITVLLLIWYSVLFTY